MSVDAVLIAGPTASGKSGVALALAERLGGTVVNADSMQVYAELRVLTARPSSQDETRASHRLYGHVPARERYSAGRYRDDAAVILPSVKMPIFTGGTGLYFAALTEGLSPIPPIASETRRRVRTRFEELGAEKFFAGFAAADPQSAASLRASDMQRVLRAADVWEETGISLKRWQQTAGEPVLKGRRAARFVIAPPREILLERIEARAGAMLETGALEEVAALGAIDQSLPAARALGVAALQDHLAGKSSQGEAQVRLVLETRQYAKRQMTWFRKRMADWIWIEDPEKSNIISTIEVHLS
jgi:tRNA dimethylallyltransferase